LEATDAADPNATKDNGRMTRDGDIDILKEESRKLRHAIVLLQLDMECHKLQIEMLRKDKGMADVWSYEITKEPDFDEKYPTDPVDWEAQLTDNDLVIFITFTGISEGDGEVIKPWPETEVEAHLKAMVKGLNQ
jgi:hypothetical protein